MKMNTIRTFKTLMLLAVPFVGPVAVGEAGSFKADPGLQLYSLRADFKKDVPGTLKKVQGYGIRLVELAGTYDLAPGKFNEMLVAHGLRPVSGHFPYERFRDDAEGVAREAKVLGLEYAGCAWIPHSAQFDEKECRSAIEVFNRAGAVLAKHGLKFFYHNHGYEFQPHGQGTLFDLLVQETRPEHVRYEMDVFWIVHPGQDPAKLLAKYGKRWELMHVKDMKKGVKTGDLTGKSDVSNDVTLGTGQMNWPAILKAAEQAGVKYYFIEDESPTAAQQIPQSLKFLKQVKW
ncbi:MAG: sugar phosphate isomerase/epimerase [Acidobacteria bacterium]|nr:sugar phosphate isomerase/epimerase [Acidobacteriota bacterium]MCI0719553.1 sugar phosphate isomerase/epimerase [Acidobacteriota bacterium]